MATKQLYSANHYHRLSFGDFGFRIFEEGGTTSSTTGESFCTLHALSDSVVSFASNISAGDSSATSLNLKEGHILYGDFTTIVLTSGSLICYLHK